MSKWWLFALVRIKIGFGSGIEAIDFFDYGDWMGEGFFTFADLSAEAN